MDTYLSSGGGPPVCSSLRGQSAGEEKSGDTSYNHERNHSVSMVLISLPSHSTLEIC